MLLQKIKFINKSSILKDIFTGHFSVVYQGVLNESIEVAVKMPKEKSMSEEEFKAEATLMMNLNHPNLVQLYGVCWKKEPFFIVTEFMKVYFQVSGRIGANSVLTKLKYFIKEWQFTQVPSRKYYWRSCPPRHGRPSFQWNGLP